MPNSAVRTFSDAAAMTPNVSVVMQMPVKIVMTMEVCLGRRPKIDKRFLPIFEPSRSPIKAMAPPVMMSTRISKIPYMARPPFCFLYYACRPDQREALRIRNAPAIRPTMFGIHTASSGAMAPLRASALPIVINA